MKHRAGDGQRISTDTNGYQRISGIPGTYESDAGWMEEGGEAGRRACDKALATEEDNRGQPRTIKDEPQKYGLFFFFLAHLAFNGAWLNSGNSARPS